MEAVMDLIDQPPARRLLADAEVDPDDLRDCLDQLTAFAQRYLPCFQRVEHHRHALTILRGKLTALQRKTTEPIATQAGQQRRPLQLFVGAGRWQDRAVLDELRQHVTAELGDPEAVFVLDNSSFPKQGTDSCGVARQWCGRLGKVENCQVGVFVAYVAARGKALVDCQLYLPKEWADDPVRRAQTHVPANVTFKESWRIGLDLLDRTRATLPGTWVVGDDEFGRCSVLRQQLRFRQLQYVLDVPCSTLVRDLSERRPPTRPGGQPRRPLFERVERWVARQPRGRWKKVRVRDGAKGPLEVEVLLATVQSKDEDGCVGARERLVVLRTRAAKPQIWYTLSNAHAAGRGELARVHGARHPIEELLGEGKGEVGLDHYEVRGWVGWHHHMTLSLVALWFLQLERLRLGGKNAGADGAAGAGGVHAAAAKTGAEPGGDRGAGKRGVAA
jgi:SRSO17 transposase